MLDEPGHYFVAVHEIAERTGLDKMEVARALDALEGPYIADYQRLMSGGDPTNWHVDRVTEAARRAVGQWPTPESLVDRLVQGLNQAAEHDTDPARKEASPRGRHRAGRDGTRCRYRSRGQGDCAHQPHGLI
jgi:hypothetical protein